LGLCNFSVSLNLEAKPSLNFTTPNRAVSERFGDAGKRCLPNFGSSPPGHGGVVLRVARKRCIGVFINKLAVV
jgi:hypothetical protein